MQKSITTYKHIIVMLEALILVALLIVFFNVKKDGSANELNIAEFGTEYENIASFDGSSWKIDTEQAEEQVGSGYLLWSNGVSLKRGTYTIVLDYNTSIIQKAVVEADEGVVKTADFFLLSNNKKQVSYDFVLATDVQGFKFRLKEYRGGDFSIDGIKIYRNTHDIRCLIFIYIILSILLDIVLFVHKIQKNKKIIVGVLAIAFIGSLPLFPVGMMTGSDITYHLVRIDGIADGLKSGAFPVKMYSVFNDDYGYPTGVFYGDVTLYFPAILRIIGFTTMCSYKIYIYVINILTLSIAYYCGKKIFEKDYKAILFSIVYTFSTYRLVCVYARAAVGEYTAATFYPIVILAIWNIYTQDVKCKEYKKNAITLAVGMACLIYTHILSTEMFVLALAILVLSLFKKTFRLETISVLLRSVLICGILCLAFIVPFLEYYVGLDIMVKHAMDKSYIQNYGCYISDYFAFFKSITGGNYETRRGILTPGLILMAGLVLGIILIATRKANQRIKVATYGSIISLFVASTIFPWNLINSLPIIGPFLVTVQFPYRYLEIAVCFLSILLIFAIEQVIELGLVNNKIYRYVALLSFFMTFVFISNYQDEAYITSIMRSYDTADLSLYTRTGNFGMVLGTEYLINGSNVGTDYLDYSVYGENATAAIIGEKGVKTSIYVDANDNAAVTIPRFAYPHFVVKDQLGNKLETTTGFNNRIRVLFPTAYKGEIYIEFIEPWYWRMAELISLVSIIGLILRYKIVLRNDK